MTTTESRRVLVVEDDASSRMTISFALKDIGYTVLEAGSAEDGLRLLMEKSPAVVISDIRLSGMSGIELLKKVKEIRPNIQVLLITAYGTIEDAVRAMNLGAENYLTKPINMEELELIVKRAAEKFDLLQEAQYLRAQLQATKKFDRVVGNHPRMKEIFEIIEQVAPSTASVLIYGESGTGKELIGEALHKMSKRASGPFVKVNCHVFSETLLESELFGHEKGAFTGAHSRREGRFEMADGGTLFLDDINVMPEVTQPKILRFLQEREFERVGGSATIKVDVRVIAATNTPLHEEVAAGRFREDLFYRLNVIPINLPPLRERRSDIPLLVGHFVKKYAARNDKGDLAVDDATLALAMGYDWPGNVRELENVMERAVVMSRGPVVLPQHLPDFHRGTDTPSLTSSLAGRPLADVEREAILGTLASVEGSTGRAARILGISVRKIQYKIKQYREEAEKKELSSDDPYKELLTSGD